MDKAVPKVRAVGTGKSSELHLGYAPTPTVKILPQLLRDLAKQAANVRVMLHDHSSPEMLVGLREGRLQAALMMQPPKPAARGVVFEKLRTYSIGVAVPPDHQFCRRRAVPMAELLREPIVAYARKDYPDYQGCLDRRIEGISPSIRYSVIRRAACHGQLGSGRLGRIDKQLIQDTAPESLICQVL